MQNKKTGSQNSLRTSSTQQPKLSNNGSWPEISELLDASGQLNDFAPDPVISSSLPRSSGILVKSRDAQNNTRWSSYGSDYDGSMDEAATTTQRTTKQKHLTSRGALSNSPTQTKRTSRFPHSTTSIDNMVETTTRTSVSPRKIGRTIPQYSAADETEEEPDIVSSTRQPKSTKRQSRNKIPQKRVTMMGGQDASMLIGSSWSEEEQGSSWHSVTAQFAVKGVKPQTSIRHGESEVSSSFGGKIPDALATNFDSSSRSQENKTAPTVSMENSRDSSSKWVSFIGCCKIKTNLWSAVTSLIMIRDLNHFSEANYFFPFRSLPALVSELISPPMNSSSFDRQATSTDSPRWGVSFLSFVICEHTRAV